MKFKLKTKLGRCSENKSGMVEKENLQLPEGTRNFFR